MKNLILLLTFAFISYSYAEDLAVGLPESSNDHGTTVTVSPLMELPKGLPVKKVDKLKEQPKWWKVTLFGLGLAPVEFFISTLAHEGSHAVAAEASGVDVVGFHPYPHIHEGMPFRFGDTHWQGSMTPGNYALTSAAPMLLDTAVLGTYGGLVMANALPSNKYAQMAMFVFAAGHWVDMANHLIARNEHTDTQKIERYFQDEHGLSETQSRLAVRGSQALVLAAGGFFLYKGIRKIFKDNKNSYENFNLNTVEDYDKRKAAEKKKKAKQGFIEKHGLYAAPSVSTDGGGMMFGGSF